MSRWYRFMYRVGVKPWEQDTATVLPQLGALLALEEAGREAPYGPALDLGCGTGRWSVELARRGWQVEGVDVVPKAITAARRRAQEAGVDAAFFEGDVTALRSAGVSSGVSFLLDVECFNHLSDSQRTAVGREVNAVASLDATMLLLVWARARRGPLPPGASRDELTAAFSGWQIVDEHAYEGELPRPLKNIAPCGTGWRARDTGPATNGRSPDRGDGRLGVPGNGSGYFPADSLSGRRAGRIRPEIGDLTDARKRRWAPT